MDNMLGLLRIMTPLTNYYLSNFVMMCTSVAHLYTYFVCVVVGVLVHTSIAFISDL